jgi:hypothetical protein
MIQLTQRRSPPHSPTPTVAPVMQCVVDTGLPCWLAYSTVVSAPSSMAKPRDGEW